VYGIPVEQVFGSVIKTNYEGRDGNPVLVRLPGLHFVDNKDGKPVGIHENIGRRPLVAVGNSDDDFDMLQWTTSGSGAQMGIIVHHTDAAREWAYNRESHIGKLNKGLDEAKTKGWTARNAAYSESFALFESSEVRVQLKEHLGGREIAMSPMQDWLVEALNAENLTISAAVKHPGFSLLDRPRLQTWQRKLKRRQISSSHAKLLKVTPRPGATLHGAAIKTAV